MLQTSRSRRRGLMNRWFGRPAHRGDRAGRPAFEPIEPRLLMSALPLITEFMAQNDSTLTDEDGDFSDWIEVHNPDTAATDLTGWYLTDDPMNLTKWQFPVTTLEAGSFLVVFASGKDRAMPGEEPHTNFALNAGGEYLALVQPDGTTVASEFGPGGTEYPNQRGDVSYGVQMSAQTITLIDEGATAQTLIPAGEIPGWQGPGFTIDGSWIIGPTGVGFDVNDGGGGGADAGAGSAPGDTVFAFDINSRATPGLTFAGFEPFIIDGTGVQTGPFTRTFGTVEVTITDVGGTGFDDRTRANPINVGAFTESDLLRDFIFSRSLTGGGLDVLIEGLTPNQAYTIEVWSFDDVSTPARISDWFANGQVVAENYTFNGAIDPATNDDYRFEFTLFADANGEIAIAARQEVGSGEFGVFLNAMRVSEALTPPPMDFTTVLQLDFNDDDSGEAGAANTEDGFDTMTLGTNGATFDGISVTLSPFGGATLDDRDRAVPAQSPLLTQDQLYDDFVFAVGTVDGVGMDVLIEGLVANQQYRVKLWSFDASSTGTRRSEWYEVSTGVSIPVAVPYTFDGSVVPTQDNQNTFTAMLTASPTGTLQLQGTRIGGTSHGVFLNALELATPGPLRLTDAITTDIGDDMHNVNSSAFVRIPFDIPADTQVNLLNMNVRYDDGFVAYLNGVEVARRNAPGSPGVAPAFNADATDERDNALALIPESINLSAFINELVIGAGGGSNVLAIHGLNLDDADGDFLVLPELFATTVTPGGVQFFTEPTPGEPNGDGFTGFVADTTFSHDRGFYSDPFDVAITSATEGAVIYYTTDGTVPSPTAPTAHLYAGPVPIATTTTLRAAAFLDGYQPTNVDTQTYVFLDHVLQQDPDSPLDDDAVIDYAITTANTVAVNPLLEPWNSTSVNGTSDTQWIPRQTFGLSGTVWQSASGDVPMIRVTIDGLEPGSPYQVYANYWDADGSGTAAAQWRVFAGLSDTNLSLFGANDGLFTGVVDGNRQLYRGHLGEAVADAEGRIFAYFDDDAPTNGDSRAWLDSVGILAGDPLVPPSGVTYPTVWQANAAGDYDVDPNIVAQWDDDNPGNDDFGIREALMSIPTMSLVLPHEDLWNATTGIYPNATSTGAAWIRAGSIEYFDPATGEEFQVNTGVQMHGGASRDNVRLKKHSFRFIFNPRYDGPGELNFPLFDDTDVDEFNTLVLKGFFTDSFATRTITDRYNPIDAQYLRDTWMRDSMLAMGNLDTHSTYVHLYINGLYWGLYTAIERPDDAFLAEHLGGEREDYDIIKDFNELFRGNRDAWNQLFSIVNGGVESNDAYQLIQGNNPDGTRNLALPVLLDVDNLIDYMILHFYGGAEDWPHHNWYAARDRGPDSQGFQFYTWDQEIVLDDRFHDRTDNSNDFTPARLYSQLRANSEFRQRFADRVQLHLFNGGALSIEEAQARYMLRADEIEAAIIGESARWGDARAGEVVTPKSEGGSVVVPVMTVDHWRNQRDYVKNLVIPQAHAIFLDRMRSDGMFPFLEAPFFNQHGGQVDPDFDIEIYAFEGDIYYTTDGSDPRVGGEAVPGITLVNSDSPKRAFIPTDGSLGNTWTGGNEPFNDAAWTSGTGGVGYDDNTTYNPYIGIDVTTPMQDFSTSAFIRIPFTVDAGDLAAAHFMTLRMRYDDGFAAYLNGTQILQVNAPLLLNWDSAATTDNPDAAAITLQEFDVSAFLNLLDSDGTNILAIHGLNVSLPSTDFLIDAELSISEAPDVNINPNAVLYDGSFNLSSSATVNTRALLNGVWSPLNSAFFTVDMPLRITEINFNPAGGSEGTEFIELKNISGATIDLTGVKFTDGIEFDFTGSAVTSLGPGEYVVVVANPTAFAAAYNTAGMLIAGPYTGALNNAGESLRLEDAMGGVIHEFAYVDAWQPLADDGGASLDLIDPAADKSTWSMAASWRASGIDGGTPGRLDPVDGALPGDVTYNGVVDITDLSRLATNFGLDGSMDPMIDVRWKHGDFNGDRKVNITDLSALATRFGQMGFAAGAAAALDDDTANVIDEAVPVSRSVVVAPTPKSDSAKPSSWQHITDILAG